MKVKSVDHTSGSVGTYFNFYQADINAVLGGQYADESTSMIYQYRNGSRIQSKHEVKLWTSANGGTIGDGHGRYNGNMLTDAAGQWETGDYFCFDISI